MRPGAVTAANQRLAGSSLLALLFLHLLVANTGGKNAHGLRLVFMLRAPILALDHDVGRQVGDAHRGIRLVDVLTAGAGGTECIDP